MGAGFIWISLICLGLTCAHNLSVRSTLLEKTKILIQQMIIETNYLNLPLYELLLKLNNLSQFKEFDFIVLCFEYIEAGFDFPIAWKKAIENSALKYKSAEKEKLLLLGEQIGKTDLDGTIKILKMYELYFDEFSKTAKTNFDKYGRLSVVTGALVGCMLFISII